MSTITPVATMMEYVAPALTTDPIWFLVLFALGVFLLAAIRVAVNAAIQAATAALAAAVTALVVVLIPVALILVAVLSLT